jgi:hypothetical protein
MTIFNSIKMKADRLAEFVLRYTWNDDSKKLANALNFSDERFIDFVINLVILNTYVSVQFVDRMDDNPQLALQLNDSILNYLYSEKNRYKVSPANVLKDSEEIDFYNRAIHNPSLHVEAFRCNTDAASIIMTICKLRIDVYDQVVTKIPDELDCIWWVLAKLFYRSIFGNYPPKSSPEVEAIYFYLMTFCVQLRKLI